ncbi:hypothetical protein VPH35_026943 [Triticum aestivum]
MLWLRCCGLTQLLSFRSASTISQLSRLISAAAPAPAVSPNPSFAVEDYLVSTCGLTRAQALKASAKLSHLKSPFQARRRPRLPRRPRPLRRRCRRPRRQGPAVPLCQSGENPGTQCRGAHRPRSLTFSDRAPRLAPQCHFPLQIHRLHAGVLLVPLQVLREPPSSPTSSGPQGWLRSRVRPRAGGQAQCHLPARVRARCL